MLCMPACSLMGGQALQSRRCIGILRLIRAALLHSKNSPQKFISPAKFGRALRAPLAQWSERWSYELWVEAPKVRGFKPCCGLQTRLRP